MVDCSFLKYSLAPSRDMGFGKPCKANLFQESPHQQWPGALSFSPCSFSVYHLYFVVTLLCKENKTIQMMKAYSLFCLFFRSSKNLGWLLKNKNIELFFFSKLSKTVNYFSNTGFVLKKWTLLCLKTIWESKQKQQVLLQKPVFDRCWPKQACGENF